MNPPDPVKLSFLSGVALAGVLFLIGNAVVQRVSLFQRYHVPAPIVGGLIGAFAFLLVRALGTPVEVPTSGRPVDFLVALLTTNMGLHVTPRVVRKALPLLPVFLAGAAVLYFVQLALVFPIAWLTSERPLEMAIILGPLSFVGIPYNLNPPSQLDSVRTLFTTPQLKELAQGMMMVGVLAGGAVMTAFAGTRLYRRAGEEPPKESPREKQPSENVWSFSQHELALVVLVLALVAAAFHLETAISNAYPTFYEGYLPVIVISYLLGIIFRMLLSAVPAVEFPKKALTALLLGPTMGLVLTYAILSIPLHRLQHLSALMVVAALLAIAVSAAFAWVAMYPLFRMRLHPYYAAVLATVFIASAAAFGPVAMSYLQRFTDEEGPINPIAIVLPLNAFYLLPWTVAGLTHLLLG